MIGKDQEVVKMTKVRRIAVWGLGKHAINRILPAINKVNGLQLVGVCSRTESVVNECAQLMNCRGWIDPVAMLNEQEVDIVYLSTPIGLHAEQGMLVLQAGKHLWCEKPFTCELTKSEDLIRLSRSKNLTVAEGFMYLHHAQFKEVQKRIQAGVFGHIKEISLKFGFPFLDRPGFRFDSGLCGGALWDVGSYTVSAALSLFKNESVTVDYVDISGRAGYDVDFDGTVILGFSGGTRALLSWHIGTSYRNEIDVWGEEGSLYTDKIFSKVDGFIPELTWRDQYGVETTEVLNTMNQFEEMFCKFLDLLDSTDEAESERRDILYRARVMDEIANYNV